MACTKKNKRESVKLMNLEFKNLNNENCSFQMKILNWRNSKRVSEFFQIPQISMEQHKTWLSLLKNEPQKQVAFVIYIDKDPIGLTYFRNITSIDCDWGMYIYDTASRGLGIGQKALSWSIDYARDKLKVNKIKLEVKNDNIAAIKCYEKLGFEFIEKKDEKFLKYKKDL